MNVTWPKQFLFSKAEARPILTTITMTKIPISSSTPRIKAQNRALVSYCVGCAFGRVGTSVCHRREGRAGVAGPVRAVARCVRPDSCRTEAGFAGSARGRARRVSGRIPWDSIWWTTRSRPLDVERRVREVIAIIWKDRAEAIEQEASGILGVQSLRDYFRKPSGFFADHVKRYSKSRRQAPIYWPLSTSSGSYTLWIYYHRVTDQTLHTALADFVDPKIREIERLLTGARLANREKEVEELADLLAELHDFRGELERVIRLPWKPNLNDGVLITASPLWKLFRLSKWQKDLKVCWQALQAGDYDWAHLALCIWPNRVKTACETDRSIAIAHGLERLFNEPVLAPRSTKGKRRRQAGG